MTPEYLERLRQQFNDRVAIAERKPGVYQLLLPMRHPDGDPYELFVQSIAGDALRLTDLGLTLMRLSYEYDLDSETKRGIFNKILAEDGAREEGGAIILDTSVESLYPAVMQYLKVLTEVASMRLYRREAVRSLFYEELDDFIRTSLVRFRYEKDATPISMRPELAVDYLFAAPRPLFIFGVKDGSKARLATIACLEFEKVLPFRSVAIHESFEELTPTDRSLITNTVDKQFTDLEDFKRKAEAFFERETA